MSRLSWAEYEELYGESREDFAEDDNRSYEQVYADEIGERI